jgi:hypothetical protein
MLKKLPNKVNLKTFDELALENAMANQDNPMYKWMHTEQISTDHWINIESKYNKDTDKIEISANSAQSVYQLNMFCVYVPSQKGKYEWITMKEIPIKYRKTNKMIGTRISGYHSKIRIVAYLEVKNRNTGLLDQEIEIFINIEKK